MPSGDKFLNIMAEQPVSEVSFDKTFTGYIKVVPEDDEQGNPDYNYTVTVNGNNYRIYCANTKFKVGDKVTVVVPRNNWNDIYIDITGNSNSLTSYKYVYNEATPPVLLQKQELKIADGEMGFKDITTTVVSGHINGGKVFMDDIPIVLEGQVNTLPSVNISFPANTVCNEEDNLDRILKTYTGKLHPSSISFRDRDMDGIGEEVAISWNNEDGSFYKLDRFTLTINENTGLVTAITWQDGTVTPISQLLGG